MKWLTIILLAGVFMINLANAGILANSEVTIASADTTDERIVLNYLDGEIQT